MSPGQRQIARSPMETIISVLNVGIRVKESIG